MDKLYLVCDECGEAFDNIDIAGSHSHDDKIDPSWSILPESEAM